MDIFGDAFLLIWAVLAICMIVYVLIFLKVWITTFKKIIFSKECSDANNVGEHKIKKKIEYSYKKMLLHIGILILGSVLYFGLTMLIVNNNSSVIVIYIDFAFYIILLSIYIYYSITQKFWGEGLAWVIYGFLMYSLSYNLIDNIIVGYDLKTFKNFEYIYTSCLYAFRVIAVVNGLILIVNRLKSGNHKLKYFFNAYERYLDKGIQMKRNNYEAKTSEVRAEESGAHGEANVRYNLKWLEDYKVINDVQVPNKLESQQIDHIVIGKNGIFHLETKNHGGTYGGIININKEGDWSITKNNNVQGMENPLNQVRRHERVIKEFVENQFPDKAIPIKAIIVLSNEKTMLEGQENSPITVLKLERLNDFIMNYESDVEIDNETINILYKKLVQHCRGDEEKVKTTA